MTKTISFQMIRNVLIVCSMCLFSFFGPSNCGPEPPPCADAPDTFIGSIDGVVYVEDSGGQMFADRSELCININGEVYNYTNFEYMQAIVQKDFVEDEWYFIVWMADFKEPYDHENAMTMVFLVDAATQAYESEVPLYLDDFPASDEGAAYFIMGDFYDRDPTVDYVSNSGEVTFPTYTIVSGGPIRLRFNGTLRSVIGN